MRLYAALRQGGGARNRWGMEEGQETGGEQGGVMTGIGQRKRERDRWGRKETRDRWETDGNKREKGDMEGASR